MARKRTTGLTGREIEILRVLWELGDAPVEQIRQRLSRTPTASTVRRLLSIMADRGVVLDDGKIYGRRFRPADSARTVRTSAIQQLTDSYFDGSVEGVVQHLVDNGLIKANALRALAKRSKSKDEGRR